MVDPAVTADYPLRPDTGVVDKGGDSWISSEGDIGVVDQMEGDTAEYPLRPDIGVVDPGGERVWYPLRVIQEVWSIHLRLRLRLQIEIEILDQNVLVSLQTNWYSLVWYAWFGEHLTAHQSTAMFTNK